MFVIITYNEVKELIQKRLIDKTDNTPFDEYSEYLFGSGNCYGESEVRRRMHGMHRLIEIIEAGKVDPSNLGENIDKKLEDLRKERIKIQTLNMERGRYDRAQVRQELFYEQIGQYVTTLPLPDFKPYFEKDDNDMEYICCIADIHYGADFISESNVYNPEITKERFAYLAGQLINFVLDKKLKRLHIASLGDTIQGILRVSDVKLNDSTVVKATVEVSRLIAQFLNVLSEFVEVFYYHVPTANHTQLRFLGTKANELGAEDLEYIISNYIKDLCKGNKRIHVNLAEEGSPYVDFEVNDYHFVGVHGHQIKQVKDALKDMNNWLQDSCDYVLMGHYHGGGEYPGREGICGDAEVLMCPSFVGSDPYSDSLMTGSKAAVKIFGIDKIYGHTETKKIILN